MEKKKPVVGGDSKKEEERRREREMLGGDINTDADDDEIIVHSYQLSIKSCEKKPNNLFRSGFSNPPRPDSCHAKFVTFFDLS